MGPPIRVLAVDDHPIFRDGLAALLAAEPGVTLVGEAGDGAAAIAAHRALHPDVTLMDLGLPGTDGVAAIRAIVREAPAARILALTTYAGDAHIRRALDAGACGYLLKDMVRQEVIAAIRRAAAGERVVPGPVTARLDATAARPPLTEREIEVLQLLVQGLRNREIAMAIGRSEATVKAHVLHIIAKLDVSDRTEAVAVGLQRGIVELG